MSGCVSCDWLRCACAGAELRFDGRITVGAAGTPASASRVSVLASSVNALASAGVAGLRSNRFDPSLMWLPVHCRGESAFGVCAEPAGNERGCGVGCCATGG